MTQSTPVSLSPASSTHDDHDDDDTALIDKMPISRLIALVLRRLPHTTETQRARLLALERGTQSQIRKLDLLRVPLAARRVHHSRDGGGWGDAPPPPLADAVWPILDAREARACVIACSGWRDAVGRITPAVRFLTEPFPRDFRINSPHSDFRNGWRYGCCKQDCALPGCHKAARRRAIDALIAMPSDLSPSIDVIMGFAMKRDDCSSDGFVYRTQEFSDSLCKKLKDLVVHSLAELGDAARTQAVATLAARLTPSDLAHVRDEGAPYCQKVLAIHALAELGTVATPHIVTVVSLLQTTGFNDEVGCCVRKLGAAARPAAPKLVEMMGTANDSVRKRAAAVFRQIANEAVHVKGDLLTLLKAGNSYAADALSSMTDHTASIEGDVAELLTHHNLGTRELAALVLCKHRVSLSNFSAHIEGICDVLCQPATSASVRREVTSSLVSGIDELDTSVLTALAPGLAFINSPQLINQVLTIFERAGNPKLAKEHVAVLRPLVSSHSLGLHHRVLVAELLCFCSRSASPALPVMSEIASLLVQCFGDCAYRLRQYREKIIECLMRLAQLDDSAVFQAQISAIWNDFESTSPWLRGAATVALAALSCDTTNLKKFQAKLADSHPKVRFAAVQAIKLIFTGFAEGHNPKPPGQGSALIQQLVGRLNDHSEKRYVREETRQLLVAIDRMPKA